MPSLGEEGIAGPFEDIPVLLVVIIATAIFLFSLVHAYVGYIDNLENQRMREKALSLSDSLRSYEKLQDGSSEGIYLGEKLQLFSNEKLNEDYNESRLGYHFRMSVLDTSSYPSSNNYTMSFGISSLPANGNRYTVTTSILIRVGSEYHTAQLIITIWS
jgi:hypothetical protein